MAGKSHRPLKPDSLLLLHTLVAEQCRSFSGHSIWNRPLKGKPKPSAESCKHRWNIHFFCTILCTILQCLSEFQMGTPFVYSVNSVTSLKQAMTYCNSHRFIIELGGLELLGPPGCHNLQRPAILFCHRSGVPAPW